VTNLVERLVLVGGVLAGHAQHAFADDVALHLVAASAEAATLPHQVLDALQAGGRHCCIESDRRDREWDSCQSPTRTRLLR